MTAKTPSDWRHLAEQASEEMDSEKLMSLVNELNRAGWEYAFRDVEGPQAQVFFKRALTVR